MRVLKFLLLAGALCALAGCASPRAVPAKPGPGFSTAQLVKTDIDRVAEAHQREIYASLRVLAEKLYRRNPRELKKSNRTLEGALDRLFEPWHGWRFAELEGRRGTQAVAAAFDEAYRGDRVLALIGGLGGMVHRAFREKTEFYVLDELDPQSLYNAARNVEIAVWKLSNARSATGGLFLHSNETAGPVANLSFEREFGKMIGGLDVLSRIVADKSDRMVVKVVQSIATAVFLPIK